MVNVKLVVNGKAILKNIEGVLRLFIALAALSSFDHDICDSITDRRSSGFIPLAHPLSQLNMRLLGRIMLLAWGLLRLLRLIFIATSTCIIISLLRRCIGLLAETLGDNQQTEVNSVLEHV